MPSGCKLIQLSKSDRSILLPISRLVTGIRAAHQHPRDATGLFVGREGLKTERERLSTVDVYNPEVSCNLRGHYYASRFFKQSRITMERCNYPPDEFRTLTVRQIQPAGLCGRQNTLGSHQTRVKRNHGYAVLPELVCHIGGHFVSGGFGDSIDRVAEMPLRSPIADVDYQPAPLHTHDSGGVRRSEKSRADTGIHHAAPPMCRLFPIRRSPCELIAIHHPLVTSPGGIDQYLETVSGTFDSSNGCCGIGVARVIALDPLNRDRQVGRANGPASGEDLESLRRQFRGNTPANAARGSRNECSRHSETIGDKKENIKVKYPVKPGDGRLAGSGRFRLHKPASVRLGRRGLLRPISQNRLRRLDEAANGRATY